MQVLVVKVARLLLLSLGNLQMATYPLTSSCNSPNDCLISLAMDLAALCDGGENGTNGCHLAGFTKDMAFAWHFVGTHVHPTLPPYWSAAAIIYTRKNYLKWWENQLAIQRIVGG